MLFFISLLAILDIIASYAHKVQWLPKMGSLIWLLGPPPNLKKLAGS